MTKHEALTIVASLCADGVLDAEEEAVLRKALAFPQRTWVGLTDDDVDEMWERTGDYDSFANAIEAKLKEKNT